MARTMRSTTTLDEEGNEQEQPRRRGRPTKHPLPIDSSVSDELIEKFGNACLTLKLEAEKHQEQAKSAMGAYRAELKTAKKAGIDPDAITWWIVKRKQEPEDLNREIGWQNRMARVMGLPIGTQLGVDFETGETVASQVDQAQLKKRSRSGATRRGATGSGETRRARGKANGKGEADPRAAYILGVDAGRAGKSPKTAGRGLTGEAAVSFQQGWSQGQKEAAKTLGPDGELAN